MVVYFSNNKVPRAWNVYIAKKKQLKDQEGRELSASSYGLMA